MGGLGFYMLDYETYIWFYDSDDNRSHAFGTFINAIGIEVYASIPHAVDLLLFVFL